MLDWFCNGEKWYCFGIVCIFTFCMGLNKPFCNATVITTGKYFMCIFQMLTHSCSGPQLGIYRLQNSSEEDNECWYILLEFLLGFMYYIYITLGCDFCKALTYFYLQKTSALACIKTSGASLETY